MDRAIHIGGSLNNLQNQLTSIRSECNAKDDLVIKHAKVAEAAIAGWEKAELEAFYLKQELDDALQQRIAAEERIVDLDAALKECMQQLRCSREEHEKEWMLLEETLGETSKRLANLDFENSHLSKTLQTKEKLIEDLRKCKSQVEANFNKLMARLDAEDRSGIRSADASYKEHENCRKKIIKLEKDCQMLRILVKKQLPGPASSGEMKTDVLDKEWDEFNHQTHGLMATDFISHDNPSRKIEFLIETLGLMEDENRTLKESITEKNNEILYLRTKGAENASKSWSLSKGETSAELARGISCSQEMSHTSLSENGQEDEISCSESWASALITELEQFTNRKSKGTSSPKTLGVTGTNLMDDFVEMEKLARSSLGKSHECPDVPLHEINTPVNPMEINFCGHSLKTTGSHSASGGTNRENQSSNVSFEKYPSWLQDITRLIMGQMHITLKNSDEILEDVRKALTVRENSRSSSSLDPLANVDHISRTPSTLPHSRSSSQAPQSDATKSFSRIIELIDGIGQPSLMDHSSPILSEGNQGSVAHGSSASSAGYIVRIFQWKSSELHGVLQRLVHTCNNLINGKATLEDFPAELISAMEWIFNHCFSIQDVSKMRDTVKKHFDWDESDSGSELEYAKGSPQLDAERVQVPPSTAALDGQNDFSQMEEIHLNVNEENKVLKQKVFNMESVQKDLEGKLQLATEKIEELLIQLRELEPKELVENQTEDPKIVSGDLDSQITVARNELNVACENSLSLELELENKINRCQELETTCIELQLQLNSVAGREVEKCDIDQVNRKLQTDWEITAASDKLAECQETILNLGKQLKELAAPMETLGKVDSASPSTVTKSENTRQRCSLLDKLLSEDNADFKEFAFLKEKDTVTSMVDPPKPVSDLSNVPSVLSDLDSQTKSKEKLTCSNNTHFKAKAVAHPSQKCGGVSLLKKIILRRRPESGKKSITMVA